MAVISSEGDAAVFHQQKRPDSSYQAYERIQTNNRQPAFLHRFFTALDYSRK